MYNIKYFKAADEAEILSFMNANPFVTICGVGADGFPVASHVPVHIENRDGKIYLQGHVMRKQDHTLAFISRPEVLVIFSGPHAYISASWYSDQKIASTWNYQVVHAAGKMSMLDETSLHKLLTNLTRHFEGREDSPSLVNHLGDEYMRTNMKAIIAFEIEVTRLDHSFKLSQNRTEKDYHNIIEHLRAGDAASRQMADTMLARKEIVFNANHITEPGI